VAVLASAFLLLAQLGAVAQAADVPQDAVAEVTDTPNVAASGVSMDWSSIASDRVQVVSVENRVLGYPSDTPHFWTNQAHSFSVAGR
jgi:hypothetical protein